MQACDDAGTVSQSTLDATRDAAHSLCLLCGADNAHGLHLDFQALPDGSVRAVFAGNPLHQGYADTMHGGLIAALLDSAMTNCLFAQGVAAVTARLNVRYRRPGRLGTRMEISAMLSRSSRTLHYVEAEIRQDGGIVATASGTFIDRTSESTTAAEVPAAAKGQSHGGRSAHMPG